MTARPILFSGSMVRALLEGRKTQTRRVLKIPSDYSHAIVCRREADRQRYVNLIAANDYATNRKAPNTFATGDLLYVRETFLFVPVTAYRMSEDVFQRTEPSDPDMSSIYSADWKRSKPGQWKPSIHMPRWASRLTLEVNDVRVQQLQEISEEDAVAEGYPAKSERAKTGIAEIRDAYPISWFANLWDSLNKGRGYGWGSNPWVVATSFEVHHCNVDEYINEFD